MTNLACDYCLTGFDKLGSPGVLYPLYEALYYESSYVGQKPSRTSTGGPVTAPRLQCFDSALSTSRYSAF